MSSNAINGVGTILQRWDETSALWKAIAEITSIKGPGMKRDTIEVTNLDSTGGWKEFIAGFREGGTVSLSMNFTRDSYDLMMADFESDVVQNYEIVLPDDVATSFEFEGYVTELPLNITVKDAVSADCTIMVTGPITVNSGANSGSPS